MPGIRIGPIARIELLDRFIYLSTNVGQETGTRFLTNAKASFNALALQPRIGALLSSTQQHPRLKGLRKWSVKGFEQHLIIYMPEEDGVLIVRIVHTTSNWWRALMS